MNVYVYVEGPSDEYALQVLLSTLLDRKRDKGIAINFYQSPEGDRKKTLLTKVPARAVNILAGVPASCVVALPDLYPKNRAFPHETADELRAGMMECFRRALAVRSLGDDLRLESRFHVFCFKHDMEALLLACPDSLARRLKTGRLTTTWVVPVEDQDHGQPPKRVVEGLFRHHGGEYRDTVDAQVILRGQDYSAVTSACPQCFGPFVDFLESL